MKLSLKSASSALVAALFLSSLSYVPGAEARGERGGGGGGGGHAARGGGGGGGAHAGGGGGRSVDARANNVRSSSVNNVNTSNRNTNRNTNINQNVNVNVNHNGGCCGGGWDNDYHPIATAAAVTATVAVTSAVIGSMVRTVPAGCVPVNYGGMVYQQCGTTWYQPQGSQYVVIAPPY
ncbi:hypothetical protein [Variovorax sp. HJSM1_2]|uniref:hypothetical protein n=1 Tax=Variovorax sp. HJSM1_2 TaxID=3366263 RepID=UPI003BC7BCB6